MLTNEYIIKLTGSACIPEPIENGHDYYILTNAQCYSEEKRDRQDGTVDMVYKLRLLGEVTISDKGKTLIKGKSKKEPSCSEILRNTLWVYHQQYHQEDDFEEYYKQEMRKIINSYKQRLEH